MMSGMSTLESIDLDLIPTTFSPIQSGTDIFNSNETLSVICGEPDLKLKHSYQFWCEGVLVSIVAIIGLTGNILAMIVLARPKLRDVFHQLLFALALFDTVYIVCGGINYTFRAFRAQSDVYTYLFPYIIQPFTYIAMSGTIFTTLAISIERYLGLCHPFLPPSSRKAWFYILPVVVMSFALNIPKFLEVEFEFSTNKDGVEVPALVPSALRTNEAYIRGYIMWIRLFSTAIIPVFLMLILNIRIAIDLCNPKVQSFGSARRQRKEINLCLILLVIVLVFFFCHSARITVDIYEFSNVEKIIFCVKNKRWWVPEVWAYTLPSVSHFMMIVNSSVNFVVYCFVGFNFRRELFRVIGLKEYMAVPFVSEMSQRPSLIKNNSDCPNGQSAIEETRYSSAKETHKICEIEQLRAHCNQDDAEAIQKC